MSFHNLPAGTWTIDATHSEVGFTVRHMMVSKVRGLFHDFAGTIEVTADNAVVNAEVQIASVDTRNSDRDNHLRSADFFDVEQFPTATFTSTSVTPAGDDFKLTGDLTLHGVTRPVTFELEFNGTHPGMAGGEVAGFTATTKISRRDFDITIDMPLEGGGAVVGDQITLTLEIEAAK